MVQIIARDNKQNHNQIMVSKDNGGPLRTARDAPIYRDNSLIMVCLLSRAIIWTIIKLS